MRKLVVRLQGNAWMAEEFGPMRAEIISLFGTADITTAYTAAMPAAEVGRRLQALNPGAEIVFETEQEQTPVGPNHSDFDPNEAMAPGDGGAYEHHD